MYIVLKRTFNCIFAKSDKSDKITIFKIDSKHSLSSRQLKSKDLFTYNESDKTIKPTTTSFSSTVKKVLNKDVVYNVSFVKMVDGDLDKVTQTAKKNGWTDKPKTAADKLLKRGGVSGRDRSTTPNFDLGEYLQSRR